MDAYTGEIRPFAGSWEPQGWAYCDGRLLNVSEYQALFSLIGDTYGGNGVNNFALPKLCERVPIGAGQRPGAAAYALGAVGGTDAVQLSSAQLPAHTHVLQGSASAATDNVPGSTQFLAATVPDVHPYNDMTQPGSGDAQFAAVAIGEAGAGGAHGNIMPSLVVKYIICLNGYYPELA